MDAVGLLLSPVSGSPIPTIIIIVQCSYPCFIFRLPSPTHSRMSFPPQSYSDVLGLYCPLNHEYFNVITNNFVYPNFGGFGVVPNRAVSYCGNAFSRHENYED